MNPFVEILVAGYAAPVIGGVIAVALCEIPAVARVAEKVWRPLSIGVNRVIDSVVGGVVNVCKYRRIKYRSAVFVERNRKMDSAASEQNGKVANISPEVPSNVSESLIYKDPIPGIVENRSPENLARGVNATIKAGLQLLQLEAGKNAQRSGWHADRPEQGVFVDSTGFDNHFDELPEMYAARLRAWQMAKIMLMVSELAEGTEELRAGHPVDHTYYTGKTGGHHDEQIHMNGVPQLKPEGMPSELADTVIRIMDFCFTEGIPLWEMIMEKLQFNSTRGHKHGGKTI